MKNKQSIDKQNLFLKTVVSIFLQPKISFATQSAGVFGSYPIDSDVEEFFDVQGFLLFLIACIHNFANILV